MNAVVTILIDGLTYASWLFIVAVGLTLVFGVLKILNIAHGSFYAVGAYAAASFVGWAATMKWAPGFRISRNWSNWAEAIRPRGGSGRSPATQDGRPDSLRTR